MSIFCGIPIYLYQPPLPKSHIARRRGARGRVRSKRVWIDKVFAAVIQPDEWVAVGDRIIAGAVAYRAARNLEYKSRLNGALA